MLATTHQLKAPFAAIDANAQLLLNGGCGPLPNEATAVVQRINARCRRLATEIQEMLQLANLNSNVQKPLPRARLDLAELLRWCMGQVQPVATAREVRMSAELLPVTLPGVEDHLKMLLLNVLMNAVTYSHRGGEVRIRCRPAGGDGAAEVAVCDDGIGIAPAKLPRIFDEHYRTNEAVRHNKESSGLGLAIVRNVARLHGIGVSVASQPGAGTTFELKFPPSAARREGAKGSPP